MGVAMLSVAVPSPTEKVSALLTDEESRDVRV